MVILDVGLINHIEVLVAAPMRVQGMSSGDTPVMPTRCFFAYMLQGNCRHRFCKFKTGCWLVASPRCRESSSASEVYRILCLLVLLDCREHIENVEDVKNAPHFALRGASCSCSI